MARTTVFMQLNAVIQSCIPKTFSYVLNGLFKGSCVTHELDIVVGPQSLQLVYLQFRQKKDVIVRLELRLCMSIAATEDV